MKIDEAMTTQSRAVSAQLRLPVLLKLVLATLAVLLPASSTTYYVSQTGDDANACTEARPCLTITRGSKVAIKPGDVLQLEGGTYNERLTLTTSGSTAGNITIRGHDGSGCPSVVNPDINSRGVRPAPGVTMQGFVVNASYISLQCIRVANANGPAFDIRASQTDIEITDSVADASATPGKPTVGLNMPYVALASMPANVTFSKNYIVGTIYGGVIYCRDNCVIIDNEVTTLKAVANGNDNDYFRFFGTNITFEHNYMHGNSLSDCIGDCHIDCFQTWNVANNSFELAQNIIITRNMCLNADQGVISRDIVNGTTSATLNTHKNYTIANNVFARGPLGTNSISPAGRKMSLCGIFGHTGNILFANNVCDGSLVVYSDGSTATHRNNIHYNGGWSPYTANSYGSIPGSILADHNLLFESARTYTGFSGDILNRDPLFVNAASGDYHLHFNSPAKDSGINVGLKIDLDGNARLQGAGYDIGPLEYGTSKSNLPPQPPSSIQVIVH